MVQRRAGMENRSRGGYSAYDSRSDWKENPTIKTGLIVANALIWGTVLIQGSCYKAKPQPQPTKLEQAQPDYQPRLTELSGEYQK